MHYNYLCNNFFLTINIKYPIYIDWDIIIFMFFQWILQYGEKNLHLFKPGCAQIELREQTTYLFYGRDCNKLKHNRDLKLLHSCSYYFVGFFSFIFLLLLFCLFKVRMLVCFWLGKFHASCETLANCSSI